MKTAPELLRAQLPLVRRVLADLAGYGYTPGTPEHNTAFGELIRFYRWMGLDA